MVSSDYKFIWADVGGKGHQSDAQLYNASELKEHLDTGALNLPVPEPLPNDNQPFLYFFLGDDAFALKNNMKHYSRRGLSHSQRIYNYRISRDRRVVENAFGILANITLQQPPEVVRILLIAAVCLLNLMRMRYPRQQNIMLDGEDNEHRLVEGEWRQDCNIHEVQNVRGGNYASTIAKQ